MLLPLFFICAVLSISQFYAYIKLQFAKHDSLLSKKKKNCKSSGLSQLNNESYEFEFSRYEYIFIILYQFVYFLFALLMIFYAIILYNYLLNYYLKLQNLLSDSEGKTEFTPDVRGFSEVIKDYFPSLANFFDLNNPNRSEYTFITKIFMLLFLNIIINLFLIFTTLMINGGNEKEKNKMKIKKELYLFSFISLVISCTLFYLFD